MVSWTGVYGTPVSSRKRVCVSVAASVQPEGFPNCKRTETSEVKKLHEEVAYLTDLVAS